MELFKLFGNIVINDKDANSKIDGVTGTARNAEGRMGKSFGKIGKAVGAAFTIGAIVSFEKKVISTYKTYDDQMRKVQAVTGSTGEAYDKLRNKAEELGSKTRFSATEAGEGMEALGRAGWSTDQIMAGVGETLTFATANSIDLGDAASVVADGLSQFGMKAEETGRFTDVLSMTARESNTDIGLLGDTLKYVGPVAGSLGYQLEDTAVAMGIMANKGIKGSAAGTQLRNIMTRMVKPTKESGAAMDALGISITDSNGEMKPFGETLGDLRTAFADLTPEQKAQYAASIAGQQGMSGLLALVNASPEEFEEMTKAIEGSAGVTQEMADTMDGGLGGAIESVKSAWEGFLIKLGELQEGIVVDALNLIAKALQGLPAVIEKVSQAWKQFKDYLSEHSEAIQAGLGPFKSLIIDFFNAVVDIIKVAWEIVKSVFDAIGPHLVNIFDAVATIIRGAMKIVKGILDIALGIIQADWERVWEGIKGFLGGIWDLIKGITRIFFENLIVIIKAALDIIKNVFDIIFQLIASIVDKVWTAIKNVTSTIWEGIKDIISTILKAIADTIKAIFTAIKNFITAVWKSIKDIISNVVNAIKDVVVNVFNILKNTVSNIFNGLKNIVSNIWNGIKNIISNIVNSIKDTAVNVFNVLKDTVGNIFNGLKNTVSNIWNGIKNTITNIVNNIKNTVSNIFNGLKGSVSGIFNGIKGIASSVWNAIKGVMLRPIEAARDGIKAALDRIKGFFGGLKLKFPKIQMPKLPRFKMTGEFGLNPPSVPRLSIAWNKEGAIFSKPTIFDTPQGLQGVGEAGAEAVLPIEKLGGILADTMRNLGYGQVDEGGRDIVQNLTINTPKHLSPSETARENKKMLQKLALEL